MSSSSRGDGSDGSEAQKLRTSWGGNQPRDWQFAHSNAAKRTADGWSQSRLWRAWMGACLDHNRLAKRLGGPAWGHKYLETWQKEAAAAWKAISVLTTIILTCCAYKLERNSLSKGSGAGAGGSIVPESQSQCEAKEAAAKIYEKQKTKHGKQKPQKRQAMSSKHTMEWSVGAANAEKQRNEVEEEKRKKKRNSRKCWPKRGT